MAAECSCPPRGHGLLPHELRSPRRRSRRQRRDAWAVFRHCARAGTIAQQHISGLSYQHDVVAVQLRQLLSISRNNGNSAVFGASIPKNIGQWVQNRPLAVDLVPACIYGYHASNRPNCPVREKLRCHNITSAENATESIPAPHGVQLTGRLFDGNNDPINFDNYDTPHQRAGGAPRRRRRTGRTVHATTAATVHKRTTVESGLNPNTSKNIRIRQASTATVRYILSGCSFLPWILRSLTTRKQRDYSS